MNNIYLNKIEYLIIYNNINIKYNMNIDMNNYTQLKSLFLNDFNNDIFKNLKHLTQLEKLVYYSKNKINYITKDIKYLINLTDLDITYNKITNIPEEIKYLIARKSGRIRPFWPTNLIKLNFYENLIEFIPEEIKYLIKLKELDLSFNKIKNISKDIKYLITRKSEPFLPTNLEELVLINNEIESIEEIKQLTNLQILNLSDNNINIITNKIKYLKNLTDLKLCNNKIKIIPEEIKYLIKIKFIILSDNQIEIIPEEIKYLTSLTFLNLSNNKIKIIPKEIESLINLQDLNLNYNLIVNIPSEISYLINLESLNVCNNNIITIPNSIIYCTNLSEFYYHNNEIEYITPIVLRFLDNLHNINNLEIYNDDQNIHNHSIQKCIFNSIVNIINQNYIINNENIINNIIEDTILTEDTKKLLIEYCEIKDVHIKTQLTFEDLLVNVWTLINSLDTKDEIKLILNTEIKDSYCKCFTGKISRLINCLNGFTDLVKINIADNQQIGNIILLIKNQIKDNYSIEKHKELVIKELSDRGFNKEIIDEWLKYID